MILSHYLTGLVGEVRLKVCIVHCVLLVEGAILHRNRKGCNTKQSSVIWRTTENSDQTAFTNTIIIILCSANNNRHKTLHGNEKLPRTV